MQPVLQGCKTSCIALLYIFPAPRIKPVLQQIRLLHVAWILTSDWIKLRGSHAIHRNYVACWKTSLLLACKTSNVERFCCEKSRTTHYFLQQLFATCNNLICYMTDLIPGWWNAQNRYSTRFAAMFQKTVARFCCIAQRLQRKKNCFVCVASRIGVRQCFLAARNSPKWSQFHIRRSLFVLKKENTAQRYYWKAKKKQSI